MTKLNRWKLFEQQENVLLSYMKKIKTDNYQEVMSEMYKYVKSVTNDYWTNGDMHEAYDYLLDHILAAEENNVKKKLIDIPMNLENYDEDDFFDVLVHDTREYLIRDHVFSGYRGNIRDIDLTNKCRMASDFVGDFCKMDGTECYPLSIYPGYDMNASLFNGSGYHFANVVKKDNEYYLVDVTYPQFFYDTRNNLDRLGIVYLSMCHVGTFVMMNEERKRLAINLLRDGYVKLGDSDLKNYLDPFTISFRNGLFYEEREDFSYTTDYSVDDYVKFINGYDSQVLHEGETNLGYQRRPLRNWQLDFSRRNS